jgi:transcriptional regulator GlxA family with amidase domain
MKKNFGCSSAIYILLEAGITEYYQPTISFRNDEEIVKKWDDYNKDCDNVFIPSGSSYTPFYVDDLFDDYPF